MTMKGMTSEKAVSIIAEAIQAAAYLETRAQQSVNHDGAVIAETVKAGEDVDGRSIFGSWKTKTKTSKLVTALSQAQKFAQAVLEYDQRQKALPGEKVTAKELPAPAK